MKKKTLSIILALTMMLSLAACGGSSDTPAAPAAPAAQTEQSEASQTPAAQQSGAAEAPAVSEQSASAEAPSAPAAVVTEFTFPHYDDDKIEWSYDDATATLTISGEGPMKDYPEEFPEWDDLYDSVEKIVIKEGVTSVGSYAFFDYPNLHEVVLPDGLEYIGESAFDNAWDLWTLKLPKGLLGIGERAFYNTLIHPDGDFVIPDGVVYIGEAAFHSAVKENGVAIPASVQTIGPLAFTNMGTEYFKVDENNQFYTAVDGVLYDKEVTELLVYPGDKTGSVFDVPETVKVIRDESINANSFLETINIPAGVETIETGAIYYDHNLKAINIDPANKFYKDIDGVLYDADETVLISFPGTMTCQGYKIPDTVKTIGKFAFANREDLTSIEFPASLEVIEECAFHGAGLTGTLTFPESLKRIDPYSFGFCDNVTDFVFEGSAGEWAAVDLPDPDYDDWFIGIPVTFMK